MSQKEFYDEYHHQHAPHLVTEMVHAEKRSVIAQLLDNYRVEGARALVAGCGLGEDIEAVGFPSFATDLSTIALFEARKIYPEHIYVPADAQCLPFQNDQFDVIVCSEVIEHIPDPEKMLAEFQRVLRTGGVLIITTPNWLSFYGLARYLGELILRRAVTSADQPIDHWYTKSILAQQLGQYFEVVQWRGVWFYPPIGLGHKTLPVSFMAKLYQFLLPIERWLQPRLVGCAHLLAVRSVVRQDE